MKKAVLEAEQQVEGPTEKACRNAETEMARMKEDIKRLEAEQQATHERIAELRARAIDAGQALRDARQEVEVREGTIRRAKHSVTVERGTPTEAAAIMALKAEERALSAAQERLTSCERQSTEADQALAQIPELELACTELLAERNRQTEEHNIVLSLYKEKRSELGWEKFRSLRERIEALEERVQAARAETEQAEQALFDLQASIPDELGARDWQEQREMLKVTHGQNLLSHKRTHFEQIMEAWIRFYELALNAHEAEKWPHILMHPRVYNMFSLNMDNLAAIISGKTAQQERVRDERGRESLKYTTPQLKEMYILLERYRKEQSSKSSHQW